MIDPESINGWKERLEYFDKLKNNPSECIGSSGFDGIAEIFKKFIAPLSSTEFQHDLETDPVLLDVLKYDSEAKYFFITPQYIPTGSSLIYLQITHEVPYYILLGGAQTDFTIFNVNLLAEEVLTKALDISPETIRQIKGLLAMFDSSGQLLKTYNQAREAWTYVDPSHTPYVIKEEVVVQPTVDDCTNILTNAMFNRAFIEYED